MILTFKEKEEIYCRHGEGIGDRELSKQYQINEKHSHYLWQLAERHGTSVLGHGRDRKYPVFLKEEAVNRVLQGESIKQVSLKIGLPPPSILSRWLKEYQRNGGMIIKKKRRKDPKP